ncbi:MAG TPA: glycosyltransferase [Thermoanaerobaculia bacterium]|nr:glycosyltransferase [Thermoanaerobaculia bacterium]
MKITVLSHNLSTNAAMRAYRVVLAARRFAEVTLAGPVERIGLWDALPAEPWIRTVTERRFPKFARNLLELVAAADGDVLIAVKPHLASFGAALVAAECRGVPVILDMDDLDVTLAPREEWEANPEMADPSRPASAVYVSLLTRAVGAASAITVSSTALQRRFGGTLLPHGSSIDVFNPAAVDRHEARAAFGFHGPTVLFPGTPRAHKGVETLARAVAAIPGAQLAVTCRPDKDLAEPEWRNFPLIRIPMVPNDSMPRLLAAADVVAIPQSDSEAAGYQMPMKVYDAMAMGRPIVASSVSDLPHVLQGCGRVVPPDDVAALATALSELLAHPEAAFALGQRARARALQSYSTERVAETLRGVVANVISPETRRSERRGVSS